MRGTLRTTSDYTCSLLKAKGGWAIFIRSLMALQLSVAVGCNSKMDVKTVGGIKKAAEAGFKVLTVSRVVTTPGQILQITGTNFQPGLTLTGISGVNLAAVASASTDTSIDGSAAQSLVKVISPEQATVTLPKQIPFGKYTLTLTQGASTQNVNLFSDGGQTDYPVFTGDPGLICSGQKFYNESGQLKEGAKACASGVPPECSRDGETGCVATTRYAVADTTTVASSVISGSTIAGVVGTVAIPLPCATDGATNCTANNAYPAAQIANFSAADIRLGKTVAGVAGSLSGAPPACAVDGAMGCIATSSFAAAATTGLADKVLSGTTVAGIAGNVTLPSSFNVRSSNGAFGIGGTSINPTLADCATDGEIGCVAIGPTYAAVFKKGLASKVLSTTTVAGVAGNVTLPAADHVLTGTSFGVSGTGSSGTLTLPSEGKVLASNGAFGVGGTGSTPTLTLPTASNVRVSNGAFGASGNSITPTLADCAADGGTSCVAVASYTAAATSGLAPKIVSGNTVAGIAGSATAESHSDCAGDGLTGCVATSTYASALTTGLASKVLSTSTVAGIAGNVTLPSASNVYTGIQYGVAGAGNTGTLTIPSASNVRSGNGTFGIGGNSITPTLADCSADGGTSCVAVPNYTAAATSGLASKIVSGNTVAGIAGSATAESHSNCAADGLTGCVATATYASALTTGLASKVLSTSTVAGIAGNVTLPSASNVYTGVQYGAGGTGNTGTLTIPSAGNVRSGNGAFGIGGTSVLPTLADCSADGAIGCVAVGPTYAAAFTTGIAPKIVSGNTVAGIAGSATAESHTNCSADGLTGCVTVAGFKSADMSVVTAGNIKSGVTVAGVLGAYPSATYTLPSASATSDLTSLAGTIPAGSYEWWGPDGTRYSGSITDAGTITPTTANQTFNTSVYRQFTVAGSANLTAGNIKSGVSLFGVTGAYPSATYLLSGADNTADLDLATFDAKIKSAANFEWFSPDGTRYTNTGNTNITAANIASGVTIFGTTGTLSGTGTIDPWNVRLGVTIGSVTGKLPVNCRNQGSSSLYAMGTPQTVTSINTTNSQLTVPSHGYTANQTVRVNYITAPTGLSYSTTYYVIVVDANTIQLSTASGPGAAVAVTAAGANVTVYAYNTGSLNTISSIDDYYNYTSSGLTYSNLWTANNTCTGVEATAGDSNVWKDVTTDASNIASTCATTPANCTYQDKISGLWWSKSPGIKDWTNALLYCSSLNYNNQTGWRLPTQKELMNAYEHGIMTASNANWLTSTQMQNYFWSSSTYSTVTYVAWVVYPAYGNTSSSNKTTSYYVSCVR